MADGFGERMTRPKTAFETTLPHPATRAAIGKLESRMAWDAIPAGLIAVPLSGCSRNPEIRGN